MGTGTGTGSQKGVPRASKKGLKEFDIESYDSGLSGDDSISISTGGTSLTSRSSASLSTVTSSTSDISAYAHKNDHIETLFLSENPKRDAETTSVLSFAGSGRLPGQDAFADLLRDCCGDAGYWQIKLFLLTSFCGFLTALHNLAYAFIGATPEYWCTLPYFPGKTVQQIKTLALPLDKNGNFSKCEHYKVIRGGFTGGHGNSTGAILDKSHKLSCSKYTYDHSEFETTIVTEWDLVCNRATLASTVQAIYMIGILVGSPIFGFVSDRAGRRGAIIAATIMFTIFSPLVALVPNYEFLVVVRFFQGMATPGLYSTSFVLAVEGIGLSWRGTAGNLFCLPFAFGFMALAGFGYYIRNWRTLQLAISAPIILQILICFFIPESPRWLIRRGKVVQAEKILRQVAKANGRETLIPPNFTQRIWAFAVQERETDEASCKGQVKEACTHPFKLFKTRKLRTRTLILYLCWLAVSMVYYGVALNAPNISTNRYMYMFLAGVLEVPSYLMVPPLIRYLGRRPTFAAFFLSCGTSLLLSLLFKPGTVGLVAFALLAKILIGAAYALIYLYASELMPTMLRASGVGSACMIGHIGSAISPYIVDNLGQHNKTYPAIIFGSISMLSGIAALFLAETRNVRLPETVSDIENPAKPLPKPKNEKPEKPLPKSKSKQEKLENRSKAKKEKLKLKNAMPLPLNPKPI